MNQFIEKITAPDRAAFISTCEPVQLEFGTILCEAGQDYEHVYFPTGALISLVVQVNEHPAFEVGMIGDEGMLGATVNADTGMVPIRAVVQGSGACLQMTILDFRSALLSSASLLRTMHHYQYLLTVQASRMMACSHYHVLAQRLALWLLMTHDRSHTDELELTHQFLAEMLGVQRSAVTIAAGALKDLGIITYQRGRVVVNSRAGLEHAVCGCYKQLLADYNTILPNGHSL